MCVASIARRELRVKRATSSSVMCTSAKSILRVALYSAMMHELCLTVYSIFLAIAAWRAGCTSRSTSTTQCVADCVILGLMFTMQLRMRAESSAAQETASGSGMFSGQAFQLGADDALTRDERELANRTFQNCMLRVVSGDITEARAQVIMNAMNDDIARAARQSRTDSPLGAELDGSGDVENATEEDLDWQGEINEDNYEWFMNASGEGMQMRARAFLDGEDGEDSDEMD